MHVGSTFISNIEDDDDDDDDDDEESVAADVNDDWMIAADCSAAMTNTDRLDDTVDTPSLLLSVKRLEQNLRTVDAQAAWTLSKINILPFLSDRRNLMIYICS